MQTRTIGLIVMCAALAACGSNSSEPTEAATDAAATQAADVPASPPTPIVMKPAPEGLPSRVAREVITAGQHKCDDVAKAERNPQDGTILANCTSGESYRVYTADGEGPVAIQL